MTLLHLYAYAALSVVIGVVTTWRVMANPDGEDPLTVGLLSWVVFLGAVVFWPLVLLANVTGGILLWLKKR